MPNRTDIYQSIYDKIVLSKHDRALIELEQSKSDVPRWRAVKALALADLGDKNGAKQLIDEVRKTRSDEKWIKMVLLEAELVLALEDGKNAPNEIVLKAKTILKRKPKSPIAKMVLGENEINSGNLESGTEILLTIIDDYPQANWVYTVIAQSFIRIQEYRKATDFISKIASPSARIAYQVVAKFILPNSWIASFAIIIPLLLLTAPADLIYFLLMLGSFTYAFQYFKARRDVIVTNVSQRAILLLISLFVAKNIFY